MTENLWMKGGRYLQRLGWGFLALGVLSRLFLREGRLFLFPIFVVTGLILFTACIYFGGRMIRKGRSQF